MTKSTVASPPVPVATSGLYDPASFTVKPADRELFEQQLKGFVPPDSFDAHAHWYDLQMINPLTRASEPVIGMSSYLNQQRSWMGDRATQKGLFFPLPTRHIDTTAANQLLIEQLRTEPSSRGLAIVRPSDDPVAIERLIVDHQIAGLKVYHLFADRTDTQNATCEEYIAEWMWDLVDRYSLCLMLHLVRDRSLADQANLAYINAHCRAFPSAKLVLAHAGRGFCGRHTVEGVPNLRGLNNLYFDTSAVCEPDAFEAILEHFGPRKLLYGSDFPISQLRGKAIAVGDTFHWLYERDLPENQRDQSGITLIGIESLLALRDACRRRHLNDTDVEKIFYGNAMQLLGMDVRTGGKRGQDCYRHAEKIMPVGVQLLSKRPQLYAPKQWPPYYLEARGCEVVDLDERSLIDFTTTGIGACLLGFADPDVSAAVQRRVQLGSMSTLNCPEEVELADRLIDMHPWSQQARFARTGGEALSVAVRIARAATDRDVVAVCGYHGWNDWYLAANLSDDEALGQHLLPGLQTCGVPKGLAGTTLPFRYNHADELEKIVRDAGSRLSAVVMEPTRSTSPEPGFMERVRELCDTCGAKLVFDEVTTGLRFRRGGAHLDYGVEPDMAVFAKALGNGHPIAAVVGKASTMSSAHQSFISSTYWTEGVGVAAALATLEKMDRIDVPKHVAEIGTQFHEGLKAIAQRSGVPLQLTGYPALNYLGFDHPQDMALMTLFTVRMLREGYLVGSSFYPTLAHTSEHVIHFLSRVEPVFAELKEAIDCGDIEERIGGPVRQLPFGRLA